MNGKLKAILAYIRSNNAYYRGRIGDSDDGEEISSYSVLTREELQKNRYSMFSKGGKAKYYSEVLIRQTSSGSTGVPVNVYWENSDFVRSNLSLWRKRMRWYGIYPYDKQVMFTLNGFGGKDNDDILYRAYPENVLMINTSLISSMEDFREIVNMINRFNPKWMYVQPYILEQICAVYNENSIDTPSELKYIEVVGGKLYDVLRKKAEGVFNIYIANMYGSEEMNGIALECPYRQMHILDDNVYVECLTKEGISETGEGEAVLTNLNNKVMPIVRYLQGDVISIHKENKYCECGEVMSIIERIEGRKVDFIELGGKKVNTQAVFEAVAEVNNEYNDIIVEYNVVYYKNDDKLVCGVILQEGKADWYREIEKALRGLIANKLRFIDPKLISIERYERFEHIKVKKVLEIIE